MITALAAIGAITVGILCSLTVIVWAQWLWIKLLGVYTYQEPLNTVTTFLVLLVARPKNKRSWYTGQLLALKYKKLKAAEPEVARIFEENVFSHGMQQ